MCNASTRNAARSATKTHEEILRVLQELHTTMKTYHSYQTECKAAEMKMRTAEQSRLKLQQSIPKEKLERSKKYRMIEKEMLKRQSKYTDARLKALKARNEYQLCLEASNTTIHKYFVEDLSDLIDVSENDDCDGSCALCVCADCVRAIYDVLVILIARNLRVRCTAAATKT